MASLQKIISQIKEIYQSEAAKKIWQQTWRLIIFVFGMTIVLIGIAMIVLPGPALVVIPLGLVVLGTEFVWARCLLKKMKESLRLVKDKIMSKKSSISS